MFAVIFNRKPQLIFLLCGVLHGGKPFKFL